MNGQHTGPIINSRHNNNLPKSNKSVFVIAAVAFIIAMAGSFLFVIEEKSSQVDEDLANEILEEEMFLKAVEETKSTMTEEELADLKVEKKEEGTADFFYQRALTKEKTKDYEGAVNDYTLTIEQADKYSAEMWNALNNRGVIYTKQFKDYKAALKDFNKIIEIETNRRDGNINAERLEAGYTNRAYIKKMKGDKEGACDDLYNALGLGVQSSQKFIEKQLESVCY